ncbi:hypothetical protein Zmor_027214 [Zophobas morio]|uniref:Polyadenylate-binding protein n=1 Tax=Zophobas morio TaxID=2755281 RepID=A0AA38HMW8_9CUCU|nr:hypothetical protein Zmor_027214 [Zophobas morio]
MTSRQGILFPLTSLYVGDLHPDVTEALLYEKFSPAGQILSLRVCRDSRTKQSLGYAYVNFSQTGEAERVLDTMNFDLLKGKPIRIMWSQRDPSLRKSGIGNVFIKNLDKSIDNKAMYDTFSAFGNILSCKVATDEDGLSKGHGFVHFENLEAANKAIEKVNGMLLNGKKVYVGKFIPRSEREKEIGEKAKKYTNVYVKNFGRTLTQEQLFEMFKKFGKVTSCVVMKNSDGSSKGFGFIAFDDPQAAEKAVVEMNNFELNGSNLYVGRAQKKSERAKELKKCYEQMKLERYNRIQGANVYIKNLDDSFDNERLRKEFSPFGNITSAKVMMEAGRSKGFGFVCYTTPEEAAKAISEMDGRMIGNKPIYVALAQRYEDRRAYLSAQCMQRIRHQTLSPPLTTPQFLIPTIPQGPRFYNHMAQIRPTPRWTTQNLPRLNGTYNLPILPATAYRSTSRPAIQVNNARNNVHARPITGQQVPISRPNSKYTANTPMVRPVNVSVGNGGDSSTESVCNSEDKRMLGERMYRVIEKTYPEIAGKITGMLLEIDISELKALVNNQDSLKAKVEEAVAVLQAHQANKRLTVQD